MSDPVKQDEETSSEFISRWLGENEPFFDDRVEILVEALIAEVDEARQEAKQRELNSDDLRAMFSELMKVVHRWSEEERPGINVN